MSLASLSRLSAVLASVLFAMSAAIPINGQATSASSRPDRTALKSALTRDLQAYLEKRGATEHLSSLSMCVSLTPNQPPIDVVAGTTAYHGGTAVTPASLYQIGSNTKAFTAVAVLQLEAQGRLSIDAPIATYLPQYPAYGHLTLRHLLDMTGGIDSYDNLPSWERAYGSDPLANYSADALIRSIYPRFVSKQGTKYLYSNTGYLLAQEAVAARSPLHSFDAEIARIIGSAGLKNTYYTSHLYAPAIARRVVAGYYENDEAGLGPLRGTDVSGYSLSWAQGAGSIVSTPEDLVKWARVLYQSTTLLPKKQRTELFSLVSTKTAKPVAGPTAADPMTFGLGVAERYAPSGSFWFYQGETLGFRAAHLYFPKTGMVVAIFANSRPVESQSHLQQLFETVQATLRDNAKP